MGKREFITVNISNQNTLVQILKPEIAGDKVIASAHSRNLLEKGWKGSRKSVPAAYLTGYIAGKKAIGKGSKGAILYTGTKKYTQRMAAALKGVIFLFLTSFSKESKCSSFLFRFLFFFIWFLIFTFSFCFF